jgi:hypothetical protein
LATAGAATRLGITQSERLQHEPQGAAAQGERVAAQPPPEAQRVREAVAGEPTGSKPEAEQREASEVD